MKKKKSNKNSFINILQKILRILVIILMKIGYGCKTFAKTLQVFLTKMRVHRPKKVKLLPWSNLLHLGLFSFIFIYYEILLRIFNGKGIFSHLIYPIIFGIAAGLFINVFTILWNKKINRRINLLVMAVVAVIFIVECLVKRTFQVYMPFSAILSGMDGVVGNYSSDLINTIIGGLLVILLFFLPTILYFIFGKKFVPAYQYKWPAALVSCIFSIVILGFGALVASTGSTGPKYTTQFEFSKATETFGLITSIRLNTKGSSSATLTTTDDADTTDDEKSSSEEDFSKYDKNVMDIDLDSLIASDDDTYKELDEYVNSLSGTSQNKYTGIFKGKNVILVCAEAFSDKAVSKKLTPTLYRMIHKGFYFSDYYQNTWGGSTSSGEYSFLLGEVPTEGVDTILDTEGHNNYFTLPNQLQRLGYITGAYHNNDYDYYDRDQTHTNLGFNYWTAQGNGIEDIAGAYPTDEEMISATFDTYVDKQPFCMYYMTVNGHSPYTTDEWKATENWDYVTSIIGDKYSETVTCYYCYQYELEKAMAALVQKLEDAGIADDTVVCLTADHYPYGLSEGAYNNETDYYAELRGQTIETHQDQDHNALIIWSECLEKGGSLANYQCEISTPTYSLDILPTLSNLFGLEYDSRMLVGRDVFSDATPLVVWNDYSWLSEKGYYDSETGFTPSGDEEVSQDYIDKMCTIAQNKVNYSSQELSADYFTHIFGTDDITDSTTLWEENYGSKKKEEDS